MGGEKVFAVWSLPRAFKSLKGKKSSFVFGFLINQANLVSPSDILVQKREVSTY